MKESRRLHAANGSGLEAVIYVHETTALIPFRNVIVIWDTTPEALREWREARSAAYEDSANASLENPVGAPVWVDLSDAVERAVSATGTPESEVPSIGLYLDVKTRKKASGKGPYPDFVKAFGKILRERDEKPLGLGRVLKWKVAVTLCKLLCFLRIHGVEGLERWVARKFSVSHAWRARAARRKARRFYRESRRRGRDFGGPRGREGVDGDRRRTLQAERGGARPRRERIAMAGNAVALKSKGGQG